MSPLAPRPDATAATAAATARPAAGADRPADPALSEAATRFEALILGEMLRAMRKATTGGGLGRSQAEATFRDLQDRIWAEGLARAAPIGLVAQLAGPASGAAAPPPGATPAASSPAATALVAP
jgi:flagellar protein FlgJ